LINKLKRIKIQKLISHLEQVKKIHKQYMSNGKVFIYAIELRKINEKILVLIKEINFQDNKELEASSIELIEHLDEWISVWDMEKNIRTPGNDDEFIFNGYKKYPKNFENLLIQQSIKLDEVE
tara:strand:- start:66 stop:434 length:369 start_codon:yes stop_codon:yes gene_type:complete